MARRLFLAGATGATGRTLRPLASALDADIISHLRPATAARLGQDAPSPSAVFDLTDSDALRSALEGRSCVLQLIGTMRKRFASGDTYETSDIGTTRSLVDAALDADVDHFVLLSSVGAGSPTGSYLKAKAEAERLVVESGIPWTIFRPSAFVGEGHGLPLGLHHLMRPLVPAKYKPIAIEDLAAALLHVALERAPLGAVLEGRTLWEAVDAAQKSAQSA